MVFLFNPLWLIKTRLALQESSSSQSSTSVGVRNYRGMLDAVKVIWQEEGLTGFYKGLVPALFLTSVGSIQFAVYESMKRTALGDNGGKLSPWLSMTLGGMSKIVATSVTYPYQVIKSRLQQRESFTHDNHHIDGLIRTHRYRTTMECVEHMWRREGFLSFFRGLVPNALKVAPAAAVTLLVYEESMNYLTYHPDE